MIRTVRTTRTVQSLALVSALAVTLAAAPAHAEEAPAVGEATTTEQAAAPADEDVLTEVLPAEDVAALTEQAPPPMPAPSPCGGWSGGGSGSSISVSGSSGGGGGGVVCGPVEQPAPPVCDRELHVRESLTEGTDPCAPIEPPVTEETGTPPYEQPDIPEDVVTRTVTWVAPTGPGDVEGTSPGGTATGYPQTLLTGTIDGFLAAQECGTSWTFQTDFMRGTQEGIDAILADGLLHAGEDSDVTQGWRVDIRETASCTPDERPDEGEPPVDGSGDEKDPTEETGGETPDEGTTDGADEGDVEGTTDEGASTDDTDQDTTTQDTTTEETTTSTETTTTVHTGPATTTATAALAQEAPRVHIATARGVHTTPSHTTHAQPTSGQLARTGSPVLATALAGGGLAVLGGGLIAARRRMA